MRQGRLTEEFRDRTKDFAAKIIRLYVQLPKEREEAHLCGNRMLSSGTATAAQVREASRARSETEFLAKLGSCLQLVDETQLWMELLREECDIDPQLTEQLEAEACELIAIMTTIIRKMNQNQERSASTL